jgi:hypothetical protein
MKKLLCLAVVALAALPLAFSQGSQVTIRAIAPVDFGGKYWNDVKGGDEDDYKTKMGFGAGAEALVTVLEGVQVGGGAQYLFNREVDDDSIEGKFGFIPVYALAVFSLDVGSGFKPYIIGRFGYDFLRGDDDYKEGVDLKGGICYTIGGGVSYAIPNSPMGVFAEGGYAVNRGKVEGDDVEAKIRYNRIQAGAGVTFSF